MKLFTLKLLIFVLITLEALPVISASSSEKVFIEGNGVVVMEVESVKVEKPWELKTSIEGFTGKGYYLATKASKKGGDGLLVFFFKITTPGNYEFRWRSKIAKGNNNTESNDSFVRVPTGKHITGEYADLSDWTKCYMNQLNTWSWRAYTKDHDPRPLRRYFDAGIHRLEISVRSDGHAIDRIALFNYDTIMFDETRFTEMPESRIFEADKSELPKSSRDKKKR